MAWSVKRSTRTWRRRREPSTGDIVAVVYPGEYGSEDSVCVGRWGATVTRLSGYEHRCGPESGSGGRWREATAAELDDFLAMEREQDALNAAAGPCPFTIGAKARKVVEGTVRDAYLSNGKWVPLVTMDRQVDWEVVT